MKVSIIIPVYKTEKTISDCILSVLNQTYQDFEIVVVNDNTPDNTMSIVREFQKHDNRIKVFEHEKNQGSMVARETGYKNASGDYFTFLDSDDTLPANSLEILVNQINRADADIVIGSHKKLWNNSEKAIIDIQKHTGTFSSNDIYDFHLKHEITHCLWGCIYKSKLFNNEFYTLQNQTIGEDMILFYQLVDKSKTLNIISDIVYNYYQNCDSSTHKPLDKNKIHQYIKMHNFKYDFLKNKNISKKNIISNIGYIIAHWYYKKEFSEYVLDLNQEIRSCLTPIKSIKYIGLKKWVKYVLLRC